MIPIWIFKHIFLFVGYNTRYSSADEVQQTLSHLIAVNQLTSMNHGNDQQSIEAPNLKGQSVLSATLEVSATTLIDLEDTTDFEEDSTTEGPVFTTEGTISY